MSTGFSFPSVKDNRQSKGMRYVLGKIKLEFEFVFLSTKKRGGDRAGLIEMELELELELGP